MSLLPPTIASDLQLAKHGYKIFPMGPYYQAFPEGGSLTLYEEDSQRNYDEIARSSKKDADAYPRVLGRGVVRAGTRHAGGGVCPVRARPAGDEGARAGARGHQGRPRVAGSPRRRGEPRCPS